jgi:hypothetical protein
MSDTEDRPENYNNITYELHEQNDATALVITQEGVKSEQALEHSEQNWKAVFEGLKEILKKQ